MTRLTKTVTPGEVHCCSAMAGALKTTMSPVWIVPKSMLSLSTMMRSPIMRVGSIEPDGMT